MKYVIDFMELTSIIIIIIKIFRIVSFLNQYQSLFDLFHTTVVDYGSSASGTMVWLITSRELLDKDEVGSSSQP